MVVELCVEVASVDVLAKERDVAAGKEVVSWVLVVNRTGVELAAADEVSKSLIPILLVVALACDVERVTVTVTGAVGHGVVEDKANEAVLVFVLVSVSVLTSFEVAAELDAEAVVEVEALVAEVA